MSTERSAWGYGLATVDRRRRASLDTWYPAPALGARPAGRRTRADDLAASPAARTTRGAACAPRGRARSRSTSTPPPADAADAYLRLHLLSHRLVAPARINLDGIFGVLANVVWTTLGPCAVEGFEATRAAAARGRGPVQVLGVDKFPRMTDYVVPTGVRIADADRVRLGAHLAAGTTVMHEGFVNYNAGTLGTSMVEGRISPGVVVGDGSDVGGGASIMGTLSGGGTEQVTHRRALPARRQRRHRHLARRRLRRRGRALRHRRHQGHRCADAPRSSRPRELSGARQLLFRRNSVTGAVEAVPRGGHGIALNAALHAND